MKSVELPALVPCMMSAYLALHQLHAQLIGASFTIKPFKLQQVHDASHFFGVVDLISLSCTL